MKRCSICGQVKNVDDGFYRRPTGYVPAACRACHNERVKAHRAKNPAKWSEYQKQWRSENPGRQTGYSKAYKQRHPDRMRDQWLRSQYGITLVEYEQMLAAQNGVCAACFKPPSNGKPLDVDHCHRTGKVRGLLCSQCNRIAGAAHDEAQRCFAVGAYLTHGAAWRSVEVKVS